jgi:hypothetical protein
MAHRPFKTYTSTFTNVGSEVGDLLIQAVNCGVPRGRITGLRVKCSPTAGVTDFQLALWKNVVAGWTPEDVDCLIWTEPLTTTESWMGGWEFDIPFEHSSNNVYVGIKMTGASVVDCYTVEVDVESDE